MKNGAMPEISGLVTRPCLRLRLAATRQAPACSMVNTWPPMVRVPVRGAPVAFGSTVKSTVPAPDPLPPRVTVTQGTLLTAVHAQPPPAVTVTDPAPPVTGTGCVPGAIEIVHPES